MFHSKRSSCAFGGATEISVTYGRSVKYNYNKEGKEENKRKGERRKTEWIVGEVVVDRKWKAVDNELCGAKRRGGGSISTNINIRVDKWRVESRAHELDLERAMCEE